MISPVDAWNDSLTQQIADDSSGWLTDQLLRRGLAFGSRPLCTVLRPRFLTPKEYALIRSESEILLRALDRLLAAALARPELLDQFRLEPWERTLVLEDPGIPASPVSRLDGFVAASTGQLWFTEYNAETPAGSAYNDALAELFLALPAMRPFHSSWIVWPLLARNHVIHSLVGAWRQFSSSTRAPTVGIIDWADVPTRSEFLLYQAALEALGMRCIIAAPEQCEYRGGRLIADGEPIDLIYKRVLINELIERCGMDHAIVRATRERAVCLANPFRCKVLHKKASLAMLSDERNASLFDEREAAAIASHVPWTRVVEERRTDFHGDTIDLVPHVAKQKDRFVLKPNDDYGGAGVVLGWEVDGDAWTRALERAIEEPFVVQERVELPRESFPSIDTAGALVFADRIVDTAPFGFDGAFVDGCLTRISTATLVNVTAGGGSTVPTFVVEPRDV